MKDLPRRGVGGKARACQDNEVLLVLSIRWLICKAFDSGKDEICKRCKGAK